MILTVFQKNPLLRRHRHFVRLLPVATFPSSQTDMQVAPSHVIEATPAGILRVGQRDESAAALIPIG